MKTLCWRLTAVKTFIISDGHSKVEWALFSQTGKTRQTLPNNSSFNLTRKDRAVKMPRTCLEISQSTSSVALKITLLSGCWVMLLPSFRTASIILSLNVVNAATLTGVMHLMFSIQHVLISQPTNTPKSATEEGCLNVVKMISACTLSPTGTLTGRKAKNLIADPSLHCLRRKNMSGEENARTTRLTAFASMDAQMAATFPIQVVTNASGSHQWPCAAVKMSEKCLKLA